MTARVRNVISNARATDENTTDSFIGRMKIFVGKILEFERRAGYQNWYRAVGIGYAWHASWIDFDYKSLKINNSIRSLRRQI